MEQKLKEFKSLAFEIMKFVRKTGHELATSKYITKSIKTYFGSDYDTFSLEIDRLGYANYSDKFQFPSRYGLKKITELVDLAKAEFKEYVEMCKNRKAEEEKEIKLNRINALKNELDALTK